MVNLLKEIALKTRKTYNIHKDKLTYIYLNMYIVIYNSQCLLLSVISNANIWENVVA